jgi:hypothetical protein
LPNLPSESFLFGAELANPSKITPIPKADHEVGGGTSITFLGRQVTSEEYDEICRNLGEFFTLLAEWDKESEQS